jgi:transposase
LVDTDNEEGGKALAGVHMASRARRTFTTEFKAETVALNRWSGKRWSALDFEESGCWTTTLRFGEEDCVGRPGGPGSRGYLAEFQRRGVDLLAAGRQGADMARDRGVSAQAISGRRRPEQLDRGLTPGLRMSAQAERAAAQRRIRALAAAFAVRRCGGAMLQETSDPPGDARFVA